MKLPQVYVINLDRAHVRLARTAAQLQKFNVEFTRVTALDGREAPGEVDARVFEPAVHEPVNIENHAIKACCISHLQTIQQAYADGREIAIVMEDDVTFENFPDWRENTCMLIATAPSDWQILQLMVAWLPQPVRMTLPDTPQFWPHANEGCAAMYAINRQGMKAVLDGTLVSENKFNLFAVPPYMVSDHIIFKLAKTYSNYMVMIGECIEEESCVGHNVEIHKYMFQFMKNYFKNRCNISHE